MRRVPLQENGAAVPDGDVTMLPAAMIPAIERALKGLDYGHVQLVVHAGQLVRIERVERIRLTDPIGSHGQTSSRPTDSEEEGHGGAPR